MTPFTGEDAATHRGQALISYVPVTNLCGKEGHREYPHLTRQKTKLQGNSQKQRRLLTV